MPGGFFYHHAWITRFFGGGGGGATGGTGGEGGVGRSFIWIAWGGSGGGGGVGRLFIWTTLGGAGGGGGVFLWVCWAPATTPVSMIAATKIFLFIIWFYTETPGKIISIKFLIRSSLNHFQLFVFPRATLVFNKSPNTVSIFLIDFSILIPLPKTPLNKSPSDFSLAGILRRLKSVSFNPFFTSSQCNGAETVAPGFGRNE